MSIAIGKLSQRVDRFAALLRGAPTIVRINEIVVVCPKSADGTIMQPCRMESDRVALYCATDGGGMRAVEKLLDCVKGVSP